MGKGLILIGTLVVLFVAGLCFGEMPKLIHYQGYLTDEFGDPLTGSYDLTFRIYDDTTSGNLEWDEVHSGVQVQQGLFDVVLGQDSTLDLPFDESYWLEVQVGLELMSRVRLTSVGYAYRAQGADTAMYAHGAGQVDTAQYAHQAHRADSADQAQRADTAGFTLQTQRADSALWADTAGYAFVGMTQRADSALWADTAGYALTGLPQRADSADFADSALWADTAGYALTGLPQRADSADFADSALWADTAGYALTGLPQRADSADYADSALWADTTGYALTGQQAQRADSADYADQALWADTADYAYASPGGGSADNDWQFQVGGTADTSLVTGGAWGIARFGNELLGDVDSTHVNLGVASRTGSSISDRKYCTVGGGLDNRATGVNSTVSGGWANLATGGSATVGGGKNNGAREYYATVGGGEFNLAEAQHSTIAGGYADTITITGTYSYLFGVGSKLTADSTFMVDMPHIRFGDESSGYEFPPFDGDSAKVMMTDGNGQLTWTNIGWADDGGVVRLETANDSVGIGVTGPTEKLDVDGTARLRGIGTDPGGTVAVLVDNDGVLYKSSSSIRYKQNVKELQIDLNDVLGLQSVRFEWKENGKEDVGLIAEDVEQIIPDLVSYNNDGKPNGVRYEKLSVYLLEALKELKAENEILKQRIEALEAR
jgi:hypothetical protein